jgi:hypothetical protein
VRKTTARILEQTQVNVQFRVQAPAAPVFRAATVRERSHAR